MVIDDRITIHGAKEHNLKNIDVEIPRNKLVVITGPQRRRRSLLAFDTIYAEGQRRYVESLSSYARRFLNIPKDELTRTSECRWPVARHRHRPENDLAQPALDSRHRH